MSASRYPFAFIPKEVTRLSFNETKQVRAEYTEAHRRDFREYAIKLRMQERRNGDDCDGNMLPDDFHRFEIHHVVPISLGGQNGFSNLALVSQTVHQEAHRLISRQTDGMELGEKRLICLPIFSSSIWDVIPSKERYAMKKAVAVLAAGIITGHGAKAEDIPCPTGKATGPMIVNVYSLTEAGPVAVPVPVGIARYSYDYVKQTVCVNSTAVPPFKITPAEKCYKAPDMTEVTKEPMRVKMASGHLVVMNPNIDALKDSYEGNKLACKGVDSSKAGLDL